ncbi:hypothetical protein OAS39_12735 [Pirellulales bacterium]|nr:hypothetical protein [Pirellulales bacterium]
MSHSSRLSDNTKDRLETTRQVDLARRPAPAVVIKDGTSVAMSLDDLDTLLASQTSPSKTTRKKAVRKNARRSTKKTANGKIEKPRPAYCHPEVRRGIWFA